ncbi:MAG: UbiA-like polyprenyltransferase [Gemmatimonadales bacterium]
MSKQQRARLLLRYANLVKLPHTVFALPFALLGVVYGSWHASVTWGRLLLVIVAFTAARFAAMAFNRVVDRKMDSLNPRTRRRELPDRNLTVVQVVVSVIAAGAVFIGAAALLNPLCLRLAPFALVWILTYSYTKRFTSWSHLWLGASLAIAPAGGYIAVTGAWSEPWWSLRVMAIALITWVGGLDMFYALQDERFDREQGLKSAVVLLGKARSIMLAKALHGVTIVALVAFGLWTGFGPVYLVGVGIAAAVLVWEHQLVRPNDLSRLDAAFFTMNGVMSIIVFLGALGDRLL